MIVASPARALPSTLLKSTMGKPDSPSPPPLRQQVWELLFYLRAERERVKQKLDRIERWADLRARRKQRDQ
jgi:hypothetical protein